MNVTRPDMPKLTEYTNYLQEIWESWQLTNDGKLVRELKNSLEEYLKVKNISLVSNGTLALQLAIRSLKIKGEVITTPYTFIATTNAILWEGAIPVFADIDSHTYNISPAEVEKRITAKTEAILAVHVYGSPCYIQELQEIADKYNLSLIFDAAHAFGVEQDNKSILRYGDITTLSMHATKVFHCIEGGAVITKDRDIKECIEMMRNHGIQNEFNIPRIGTNAKLSEFHAAMGLCNLKNIDNSIYRRSKIYKQYVELLSDLNVQFQEIKASRYNYSYMPIVFENKNIRDMVYNILKDHTVNARKYFYPLVTEATQFSKTYNYMPAAKKISDGVLCLPIYPSMNESDVNYICDIIKNVVGNKCSIDLKNNFLDKSILIT